jgi:tetrahydromethanopterin S-methyltransferase subunit B
MNAGSEEVYLNKMNMAKESIVKENAVVDALRRLKEEETELVAKLKPVQEAIAALEKIVDKSVKKPKPAKDQTGDNSAVEEMAEAGAEA